MGTPASAGEVERIGTPPAKGVEETQTTDCITEETMVVVEYDPPTWFL